MPIDPQQRQDKRAADDRNRGLEAYQRRVGQQILNSFATLAENIGTAVADAVAARAVAFVRSDESAMATSNPREVLDASDDTGGAVLGWEFENTSIESADVEEYTPRVIWYYAYEPGTTPPEPIPADPETNPTGHPGNGWRYLGPGDEKVSDSAMSLTVLRDGAAGNDLPFALFVKRATTP